MPNIVAKAQLSPNVTRLDVVAPRIAQIRQPGQFVIVHRAEGVSVVAEAGSVQQAIRRAEAVRPMVILSDLRLPDGTGLDVIAYVAEHLPETRIVVLTSYDDDDARAAAKAAGAHGFVTKTASRAWRSASLWPSL